MNGPDAMRAVKAEQARQARQRRNRRGRRDIWRRAQPVVIRQPRRREEER